jgi:Fic family protein
MTLEARMSPFAAEKLPLPNLDWAAHVPMLGRANRALAKYEGVLYGVPNPAVLLAPLTTQEAVLSSKIEGTQASFNDVLQFEAGELFPDETTEVDIREIQNYRRALREAEEELRRKPMHLNLLLRMHETLLDSVRGRDKGRGRFRSIQNWIGVADCPIEQAAYVPPAPEVVPELLDNWEKYYHSDEKDPLVQLALVHAQFEVIHPFLDGNGRIGRILVPLFLHEKKVLSRPMFYLSAYLESHRDEYINRLRALGSAGAWDEWVQFFLVALEAQAELNSAKARAIVDLYESLKAQVIEVTHSQFAVPLLDFLFERPIFNMRTLTTDKRSPSAPMVATLVRRLREQKILTVLRESSGRRPAVLALPALVNLCEGRTVLPNERSPSF